MNSLTDLGVKKELEKVSLKTYAGNQRNPVTEVMYLLTIMINYPSDLKLILVK